MPSTMAGAGTLLRHRRARSLTQSDLARVAGVSTRTIRGLERDEIARPQVATLQQLALGLGLDGAEQADFLHAWAAPDEPDLRRLLATDAPEAERIDALTRAHLGSHRTIHLMTSTHVDARRRIDRVRYEYSTQAVADGLDALVNVVQGDQSGRAASMHLERAIGCTVGERWDFPGVDVAIETIRLPRPLARGERHAYGYDVVTDHEPGLADSDGFTRGTLTTSRLLTVAVEFETPPATLHQLAMHPGRDFDIGAPVELDPQGRAAIVLEDEGPVAHGFVWSW